ncbi:MAG TPA: hypothetical protein VMG82_38730 [Candidatus Sulfotelmatobacter sp.]|nr:hypothetical protein [Candidatus Sulfotelmatobacter sp.]
MAVSMPHDWQSFYKEAVLETDPTRLPLLIRAAHDSINARMEQLKQDHQASAEELQAIEDALAALRVLRREVNFD